jgi:PPE-repeat protein
MVDYGVLPPEINSARIYAGPGVTSLLEAAVAWSGLASDLQAAASGHRSVIEALTTGPWAGPASVKLVSAVGPFVSWLELTAEEAGRTSTQAGASASAYETALAASVPPPLIAANRVLLSELVATNVFGQNSQAIATTEGQYAEFWAQDSNAMYTYAGRAASTTQLAALPAPAQVTDPLGLIDQALAVIKAQDQVLNEDLENMRQIVSPRVGDLLRTLSTPLNNGKQFDAWLVANTPLDDVVALYSKYLSPYINSIAAFIQSSQAFGQVTNGLAAVANFAKPAAAAVKAAEGAASAAGGAAANLGGSLGGVAAGLGKAVPLGALSVPASWHPWSATLNPGSILTGATAAEGGNGFPMAPPFGQFVKGDRGFARPTYGFKPSVMARPPAAG